jgi:hypothetical protein
MERLIQTGRTWSFNKANFLDEPIQGLYIEPKYEIPDQTSVQNSPYLIVSAPGAVGKSAFGQHLLKTKNAMLWNLAKLRLGTNTFVGSILEAIGPSQLPQFLTSIANGETTLVFDAIDEAELHSGWSGVQDFVKDVIAYTSNAAPASVIFLARRDTAEMLELALADLLPLGRSFATAGIRFFSKASAVQFVLAQIERLKGSDFFVRYAGVLESKAKEAISMSIAGDKLRAEDSEWGSSEQERFFGYAPVLQTIAKLLAESDNPYALSFEQTRSGYADVVSEILELILDREQSKINAALAQRFAAEKDVNVTDLYSRADQQSRILSYLNSDLDAAYSLPSDIKPQTAATIIEMLKGFLPQHPFLDGKNFAGPAFRDYVLAHGLTCTERRFACELWTDTVQPLFTPILASLYRKAAGGLADSADAELLYESANAGALIGQSDLLIYSCESDSDGVIIEIDSDDTDPLGEHLIFRAPISREIRFSRRLNNAQIVVPTTLVLGKKGQRFDISDCEVSVNCIRIEAGQLRVRTEMGGLTHIECSDSAVSPGTLKLEVQAPELFTVSWPGSKCFPWTPYSSQPRNQEETVEALTTLHVISRILGWFRKDRRKEYGRYRDLIVKHVVGESPNARYALGFIEHVGALSQSNNLYFVDMDIMDRFEISWQKIRGGTVSDSAIEAVRCYLRDTPQPPRFQ